MRTEGELTKMIALDIDGSSGDEQLEREMAKSLKELFEIFKVKQSSYGPRNISMFGEKGVIVRLNDKLQRLIRIVYHGLDDKIEDEKIDDTYIDLADYALIALLIRRGKWPN